MSKILMILLWILLNKIKLILFIALKIINKKLTLYPNLKLHLYKLNNLPKNNNLSKKNNHQNNHKNNHKSKNKSKNKNNHKNNYKNNQKKYSKKSYKILQNNH
jgi:hypothetical protein